MPPTDLTRLPLKFSGLAILATVASTACSAPRTNPTTAATNAVRSGDRPAAPPRTESWVGVYASPSEIGGFTGTVLAIEQDDHDSLRYRKTFYSDSGGADVIREAEKSGRPLAEGACLYLPEAIAYRSDGNVATLAHVTRYTLLTIQGRTVLLRDDAFKAYREKNRLYDYGILIKVSDRVDFMTDLKKVKHESIRTLYRNPSGPWADPFVHGPNER